MFSTFIFLALVYASAVTGLAIQRRAIDFFDRAMGGGSIFDNATFGGEPLNVIISGRSASLTANLGDGNGSLNQAVEFRQDFGNDLLGTCLESLLGGNHFRVWRQGGPSANSGALFLAASKEKDATKNHDLVDDGYNVGRDELIAAAVGMKSHHGNTVAQNITGIMPAGSDNVNHGIAVDGTVTLLTVTIT
ncbi:hypothetical protein LXA43DRAFT_1091722 [Ganoderma leucocontextum]|nr:hypothetical protein LXA43DRAFT_1091722 [Ganoderma leucocontextum]